MLEIHQIETFEDVKDETLRYRVKRASTGRSLECIAKLDGNEVGLLSLDIGKRPEDLDFIYEVYVLPDHRSKGVGEKLVKYAECQARSRGCLGIRLEARAFDHTIDTQWLISWYGKQGYVIAKNSSEYMEKSFSLVSI
ncbi:GNAT family N-acetyltransferase [Photobacterium indicum]|uniref:GNAT family N-acetyltransferase n=1 Tax=Photobacterium indicum TaxID=81447 RepID=UPI00147394F2|nr:GNAT family N-acetyltransferase [Photobacterium indicum]